MAVNRRVKNRLKGRLVVAENVDGADALACSDGEGESEGDHFSIVAVAIALREDVSVCNTAVSVHMHASGGLEVRAIDAAVSEASGGRGIREGCRDAGFERSGNPGVQLIGVFSWGIKVEGDALLEVSAVGETMARPTDVSIKVEVFCDRVNVGGRQSGW